MLRILLAFPCVLFLSSLGAFFLFIPPLLIMTAELFLTGFMVLCCLGIQLEFQPGPPADAIDPRH